MKASTILASDQFSPSVAAIRNKLRQTQAVIKGLTARVNELTLNLVQAQKTHDERTIAYCDTQLKDKKELLKILTPLLPKLRNAFAVAFARDLI